MIENSTMHVEWWPSGSADIRLAAWFPATAAQTRKLVREVICRGGRCIELLTDLSAYLKGQRQNFSSRIAAEYEDKAVEESETVQRLEDKLERARASLKDCADALAKARRQKRPKKEIDFLAEQKNLRKNIVDNLRTSLLNHRSGRAEYTRKAAAERRAIKLYDADIAVVDDVLELYRR